MGTGPRCPSLPPRARSCRASHMGWKEGPHNDTAPVVFITHRPCHIVCDSGKFCSGTAPNTSKTDAHFAQVETPLGGLFSWALGSVGRRGQEGLSRGSERHHLTQGTGREHGDLPCAPRPTPPRVSARLQRAPVRASTEVHERTKRLLPALLPPPRVTPRLTEEDTEARRCPGIEVLRRPRSVCTKASRLWKARSSPPAAGLVGGGA